MVAPQTLRLRLPAYFKELTTKGGIMEKREYMVLLDKSIKPIFTKNLLKNSQQSDLGINLMCDYVDVTHHYLAKIELKFSKSSIAISFPLSYVKAIYHGEHLKPVGFCT